MVLRLGRPPGFDFTPGQHVKLGIGDVERRYSLASAPGDSFLEVAVERVPGGRFTSRLWGVRPGDRLRVGPPRGDFVLDRHARAHLMVATVTGVSPFVSMLRHALREGAGGRFVLLHGASYRDELVFADELGALARAHPDRFTYVPAVSRPGEPRNAGWRGATGRLGPLAERHAPPAGGLRVYACGHPGMIADIRARFGARDVSVSTEAYW